MPGRARVGIVKADGSGFTHTDFSTAALNELRAGQHPQDFGDRGHHLPEYTGDDMVEQSEHQYQDGGY